MGKQKKHQPGLSTLNRAFAFAMNFPTQPDEFKRELARFRSEIRETREHFGLTTCVEAPPKLTPKNIEHLEYYAKPENQNECAHLMMKFVMDEWYKHKRVFIFTQETIDYVLNTFPAQYIPINVDECIAQVCRPPIFIECPDSKNNMGAFWGQGSFSNKTFDGDSGQTYIKTLGAVAKANNEDVYVHITPSCSVVKYYELLDDAPEIDMIKLLIYLYFVITRKDSFGTVLVPKPRNGADCWEVKPLPSNCSIPTKSGVNVLISTGLCLRIGFLYRENFVKEMQQMLIVNDGFKTCDLNNCTEEEQHGWCSYNLARMALDWEEYRVVYKYNTKAEESFGEKYFEDAMFYGFEPDSIKFFPQSTIVLYQEDLDIIALASLSLSQQNAPFITLCVLTYKHSTFLKIPINKRGITIPPNQSLLDENIAAICALYHILHVYKDKAIKKAVQNTLMSGNPATTAIVPAYPTHYIKHSPVISADHKMPALYREGELIEDVPFELFSLTGKAVIRQRQEEQLIRNGWKMTPHTRRPHPHRYWVGKGAERHLEIRWLERIQVHKEQQTETTTIHTLK